MFPEEIGCNSVTISEGFKGETCSCNKRLEYGFEKDNGICNGKFEDEEGIAKC